MNKSPSITCIPKYFISILLAGMGAPTTFLGSFIRGSWLVLLTFNGCDATGWWEAPSVLWEPVHPLYNWGKRRTGITPFWYPSLGVWTHFNASALIANPILPTPWAEGRMVRNLRQLNVTAYEMLSVYEHSAVGKWPVTLERTDGLFQSSHLYMRTPYRITRLPVKLPASVSGQAPEGYDSSRVTIVEPDAASFAGPRWIPTSRDSEILRFMNEQGGQDDDRPPFYRRWQFCELWLTETVHGCPEGRRIGLFCQYDGLSGELVQIFRMAERAMLPTTTEEALAYFNPQVDINMNEMEDALNRLPSRRERLVLKTSPARALRRGESIVNVIKLGRYSLYRSRVVKTESLVGPEVTCSIDNQRASDYGYESPVSTSQHEAYMDARFDDGVYAIVPKRLDPTLDEIAIEMGCLTSTGDFHRLMATGSRSSGGFTVTVYEKWARGNSLFAGAAEAHSEEQYDSRDCQIFEIDDDDSAYS
jgi:hypothetical protein